MKCKNQIDSSPITTPEQYLLQMDQTWQTAESDMSEEEQSEWRKEAASDIYYTARDLERTGMSPVKAQQAAIEFVDRVGGPKVLGMAHTTHLLGNPLLVFWCMILGLISLLFIETINYPGWLYISYDDSSVHVIRLYDSVWEYIQGDIYWISMFILPPSCGVLAKTLVLQISNPYRARYFSPFWTNFGACFPESFLEFVYTFLPISMCIIFTQYLTRVTFLLSMGFVLQPLADAGYTYPRVYGFGGWNLGLTDWVYLMALSYAYTNVTNRVLQSRPVTVLVRKLFTPAFRRFHRSGPPWDY